MVLKMKKQSSMFLFFFVHLFYFSASANFQETAIADSEKFVNKTGQYSETHDGVLSQNNTPCFLDRTLKPSEHYSPDDAKDFSSFSINVGNGPISETIPSIIYYIFSSGKYSPTSGAKGAADRTVLDDGSVSYANPTASYDGFGSCGAWGHIGKPKYGIHEEFILGPNYIQYISNYRCKLFGGEEHQIVKTCAF